MMDQLVNTVVEKTGLSQEQARSAADAVIGFLKDKLPAPIGGAIDSAVGGGGDAGQEGGGLADKASGMLGGIGGMFGGNKE